MLYPWRRYRPRMYTTWKSHNREDYFDVGINWANICLFIFLVLMISAYIWCPVF